MLVLKSDHFGIEMSEPSQPSHNVNMLKSDHFGIEMYTCLDAVSLLIRLKSDHFGIEIDPRLPCRKPCG